MTGPGRRSRSRRARAGLRRTAWTLILIALPPAAEPRAEVKLGPVLAVAPGGDPRAAATDAGGFLVVWGGASGRVYDGDGTPLGPAFQVNELTANQGRRPDVSVGSPDAVVVWQSGERIVGRRVTQTGVPVGADFQVSTDTTGYHSTPAVALEGGAGLAVWTGRDLPPETPDPDGSGDGVFGRAIDAAGDPLGAQFQVNAATEGDQLHADVAAGGGQALVVWIDGDGADGLDGSGSGVFARRMALDGQPLDDQFQVNAYTTGSQCAPSVAAVDASDFVVVWGGAPRDGSEGTALFGRRFDSSGGPLGGEFQVKENGRVDYCATDLAAADDGGFVVTWLERYGPIAARRFPGDGAPPGRQLTVNDDSFLGVPSVAALPAGQFAVLWNQTDYTGTGGEVHGQRLTSVPFAVTTTEDRDQGSCELDDCSLREAVAAATGHAELLLPAGTYDVSLGELELAPDLMITGAGPGATVLDAKGSSRVLRASAGEVELEALAVRGGLAGSGAGLLNDGADVTLRNVLMESNVAGVAGGAIEHLGGALSVLGSTLRENVAGDHGGAIESAGELLIAGSTLTGNVAQAGGGALHGSGGLALLANSTFHGNDSGSSGGALQLHLGTVALRHVTLTANSAPDGVTVDAFPLVRVTFGNTLLDGTCGGGGAYVSDGGNIESPGDSCALRGPLDQPSVSAPDLGLAAELADNGGPTATVALLPGSAALDTALDDLCLPVDQRGQERPMDGDGDQAPGCDVGAYEAADPSLIFRDGFERGDTTAWDLS